jgi:hypothetical protein
VYNDTITNIQGVFESFNDITPGIKFTMEKETEKGINFLDVTIRKEQNVFTFSVYKKPTTTDSIISLDSCHPQEHKHAATHHLVNTMNTYNINAADEEEDRNKIKHIVISDKYDVSIINRLEKPKNNSKKQKSETKWAKFTYIGKETKFITKLFKDSSINITFTTSHAIKRLLSTKPQPTHEQFDNIGVYQLTCPDCRKKYIGQTGRSFRARFSEHFRDYK